MKVIFLDIDGVLYPCFSRRTSCFHAEAVRSRLQKEGISTEGITDWDLCSVVCGYEKGTASEQIFQRVMQNQ